MITVRPIRPEEWPRYRDLRLRALRDAPDAFGSTWALEAARPDAIWSERLAAAAASGRDLPLFAERDGQLCGLGWCKLTSDAVAEVFQMWVAPEARRHGVGAALLRALIDYAAHTGAARLRLGVTVGSPAARLYAAHGFVPVGDPSPLREGAALLAQAMELDLAMTAGAP